MRALIPHIPSSSLFSLLSSFYLLIPFQMVKQYTLESGYILSRSDSGLPIRNIETGDIYESAIDNPSDPHEYEEVELSEL